MAQGGPQTGGSHHAAGAARTLSHDYEVVAREQRDGYEAQKILFNINKWERVAAYLLVPKVKKAPALLMLHDHGAHFSIGKEKMVRPFGVDSTLLADAEDWAVRCYDGVYVGDELAKAGYVVLSIDALFWGDRGRKRACATTPSRLWPPI